MYGKSVVLHFFEGPNKDTKLRERRSKINVEKSNAGFEPVTSRWMASIILVQELNRHEILFRDLLCLKLVEEYMAPKTPCQLKVSKSA